MIEWATLLATVVNVSLVAVLVWVTNEYRKATREIVEETVKDRRIRRIERALEEFYYPLWELSRLEVGWFPYDWRLSGLSNIWNGVKKYKHLAWSRDVRMALDNHLVATRGYSTAEDTVGVDGLRDGFEKVIVGVLKDIDVLQKELGRLRG